MKYLYSKLAISFNYNLQLSFMEQYFLQKTPTLVIFGYVQQFNIKIRIIQILDVLKKQYSILLVLFRQYRWCEVRPTMPTLYREEYH